MKRYLTLLMLCAVAVGSTAQHVAPARLLAAKALHQTALPVEAWTGDMLAVYEGDEAFAIVTTGDEPRVIATSDGPLCLEGNAALQWYLDAASAALQRPCQAPTPPASDMAPRREPLLASVWSQSKPFNNLCPTTARGQAYPCGCVATALSQIMFFHRYPQAGRGMHQYSFKPADGDGRILSADFAHTSYDWANMLADYADGYTDEQALAVATLTLHCGVAVDMQYTASGSGAYSSEARSGLINYFAYDENLTLCYRDYYSQQEWMHLVFSELSQGRPIYYTGSDSRNGGHAFVLDGYDENGLVHVNWGWGPNGGNGYYDIALLNPSGYEFSSGQDMIIGIARPGEGRHYESHLVSDYAMNASKVGTFLNVGVGASIWNLSGYTWTGRLAILMANATDTITVAESAVTAVPHLFNALSASYLSSSLGGLRRLPEGVPDGTYRLYVAARDESDTAWRLVRRRDEQTNSYIVVIDGGQISSLEADSDDQWARLAVGIRTPTILAPASSARSYDLLGRPVATPRRGVYLQSGRKVMVR